MNLSSLAGFHDHDRTHLMVEYGGDVLFHQHEKLHDRALTETAFGGVQLAFALAARKANDEKVRQACVRWVEFLFPLATRPHEIYATYLSVKGMPQEQHVSMLAKYPPTYLEYYRTLAKEIDG